MAESAKFTIGGREWEVRALSFLDLEELKDQIMALGPTLPWIEYSSHVLHIVAHQTAEQYKDLARICSGREALNLPASMNELLRVSGFDFPGEAVAATENPGTGTLTSSSQNSPPTESSLGTSTQ